MNSAAAGRPSSDLDLETVLDLGQGPQGRRLRSEEVVEWGIREVLYPLVPRRRRTLMLRLRWNSTTTTSDGDG